MGQTTVSARRASAENDATLLSVIVPVYNEVRTIFELLARVCAAPYAKQVIVVDDGSNDGTAEALLRWRDQPEVELLRHAGNRGKSAAIRTALRQARGRFTIIQDADLEYDPADYPLLIEPLVAGTAEVVYGSRYMSAGTALAGTQPEDRLKAGLRTENRLKAGLRPPRWGVCRCGVGALNLVVRILYGARLTDEATCYKAFPTDVLRRMDLVCEGFEFCPEATAKALRMGLHILEVPIHYDARTVRAGKKLRWTDGLAAIAALWKWRKWRPVQRGANPCAEKLNSGQALTRDAGDAVGGEK